MARDRFVTIRHPRDVVEAEMLKDLLEQEGIAANIPGVGYSSQLGNLAAAAVRIPLQVHESDAERAKEILDALEDYEPVHDADEQSTAPGDSEMRHGEGPYRAGALTTEVTPRRAGVAIGAAVILPFVLGVFGAGHFYARSYLHGALFLALGWTAIVVGFRVDPRAFLAVPLVVLLDAVLAARFIRAQNSENSPSEE